VGEIEMKILLLSPMPPPAGGIASWTTNFIQSKQAKMHDVRVVDTKIIGSRVANLKKRNIKDEAARNIHIVKELMKELKEFKPDIVHINTSCSSLGLIREFMCARLVANKKIKLVVHCHCDVSYMIKSKVAKIFFRKLICLSDRVITLNKASQEFIYNNFNKKGIILPNFISNELMDRIDANASFKNNRKQCLFVGHIGKAKGCDVILEVAHLLPSFNFVMVGLLSEEIRQMKQPDNVVYVGEVSQEKVIDYMKKSNIFISPSLSEGFPVAILEAMACGLPVVTTPVGAIPDMIEDQGGVMITIGDVRGFVSAIEEIAANISLYKEISKWNVGKVKNYYVENVVIESLFSEYLKLLNGSKVYS
jgi:glycosyltransferase involved in cell wall biosynthesis